MTLNKNSHLRLSNTHENCRNRRGLDVSIEHHVLALKIGHNYRAIRIPVQHAKQTLFSAAILIVLEREHRFLWYYRLFAEARALEYFLFKRLQLSELPSTSRYLLSLHLVIIFQAKLCITLLLHLLSRVGIRPFLLALSC